jgi:histidine triad (HIT) family protein
MSEDCLFCRIVAGEVPGRIVYEDEAAAAFLDVDPLAAGHTLVVPKTHRRRLNDLEPAEAGDLFRAVTAVTAAVETAVDAPATTVAVNNGPAAGQEIHHVHVHVVPRWRDDGTGSIHALFRALPDLDEDDMADIEDDIAAEL